MSKFHVNSAGEPGKCRAEKGGCPFGGEGEHYGSADEARTAFEAQMGGSFAPAPDPIKSMFKAPGLARESEDAAVLMQVARGGNRKALRELAENPAATAEVLAEAVTKLNEDSKTRDKLEQHPNFPVYALREASLTARLKANEYAALKGFQPEEATDAVLTALVKDNPWSGSAHGQVVVKILQNPPQRLSDSAIEAAAEESEPYAEAAGAGGRFPSAAYLEEHSNHVGNVGKIIASIKGIQDPEKLREVWSYMKESNWASWSAENLGRNPHTPQDLFDEFRDAHKWHAHVKEMNRHYRPSSGSPYGSSSSSSSSDSGIMSPLNPMNPTTWS